MNKELINSLINIGSSVALSAVGVPPGVAAAISSEFSQAGIRGGSLEEQLQNAKEFRRKQEAKAKETDPEWEKRFGDG